MTRWTMTDVVAAQSRMAKPLTQSKYRNVKTNGYASKREARRADQLKLMQKAGEISELREQVSFQLIPAQRDAAGKLLERSCVYVADFVYQRGGHQVVEDAKGVAHRTYVLKRKLMLFLLDIRIRET